MNVSQECGIAASNRNQILGLIRRNIVCKEKITNNTAVKTIDRPHLEYCIQTLRPYRKKDIDILERVQRRATKFIPRLRGVSYEMRLNRMWFHKIRDHQIERRSDRSV